MYREFTAFEVKKEEHLNKI